MSTVGDARRKRGRRLLVALPVVVLLAAAAVGGPATLGRSRAGSPVTVTVMTRNLYLGGDITRPVRAAQGRTGTDALLALGHAAAGLRTVVDETDFPTRARLLAAEIADRRPALVGLQEVALWRHGPLQLDHPGRLDATEVDLDFLAVLRTELAARDASYDVAVAQDESDVEAPAFTGDPRDGNGRDVRLTMRDVVLVRTGVGIEVTGTGSGRFAQRLDVDLGGLPFAFVRGYAFADVRVGGRPVRFVTTQLESQGSAVALAQARELLAGPLAVTGPPVVLACDCNSDPAGTGSEAAAYGLLTGSGLTDAWLGQPDREGTGATCCLGERLDAATPTFDRRVDLVLSRGAVATVRAGLVGASAADRDPTGGLWSSDHAGLVAELRLD